MGTVQTSRVAMIGELELGVEGHLSGFDGEDFVPRPRAYSERGPIR